MGCSFDGYMDDLYADLTPDAAAAADDDSNNTDESSGLKEGMPEKPLLSVFDPLFHEVFVLSKIVTPSVIASTPQSGRRKRRDDFIRESGEAEEEIIISKLVKMELRGFPVADLPYGATDHGDEDEEVGVASSSQLIASCLPPPDRPIFVGVPTALGDLHDHNITRVRVITNLPASTTEGSLRSRLHAMAGPTRSIRMIVGDFDTGEFGGAAAVEFTDARNAEKLSGAKQDDDVVIRRPTEREWKALGEGDWPGLSYGRIDPQIQRSLCMAEPPDARESRRSPSPTSAKGSWASVFASQKASSKWTHHRLNGANGEFSCFMPPIGQLVLLLCPLLAAAAAALTDEAAMLGEIEEAGKTGRSIRDVINGDQMEELIKKQWWSAALAAIKLDHEQQSQQGRVDFYGPSVRKATREIKAKADELVRSLDQNYFKPQKVAPAFQWAQNDTAIFINVKFTRRWNAPGALDIRNPEVNITENDIHVTAVGEHSGKKHKYTLHLSFFDNVDPSASRWAMASVGKLSATLVKANRRSKWPRLLVSKDRKVTNMHYWMDFAELHEESLAGLPTPHYSLVTCRLQKKAYCVGDDKCVDSCADDCSGKLFTGPDGRCHGKPQEEVSQINFTDVDPRKGFISGTIEVNSTAVFGDAEFFAVYFLDKNNTKLSQHPIFKIPNPKMRATRLLETLPEGIRIPEEASKITAVPANDAFGESDNVHFATVSIEDWAVPGYPPQGLELEDTSPEVDELGGVMKILPAHSADSQPSVDFYTLYWGRSSTSCEALPDSSRIGRARAKGPIGAQYDLGKSMAIKKGAESILAFSMHDQDDGEHPSKGELTTACAIWPIHDRSRPSGLPRGISIIKGGLEENTRRFTGVIAIDRADREEERRDEANGYSLWWCDNDGKKLSLIDTREIKEKDIPQLRLSFKDVEVADKAAAKICGFMMNSVGDGKEGACVLITGDATVVQEGTRDDEL